MKLGLALILTMASYAHGGEIILRDSDCKVLGPKKMTVKVISGSKAEYTCVIVGSEATCSYRDIITGKQSGMPTKYEIIQMGHLQMWFNDFGNIKLLLDEEKKTFIYGMTAILMDKETILSKQCVGKIVRIVK